MNNLPHFVKNQFLDVEALRLGLPGDQVWGETSRVPSPSCLLTDP